MNNQNSDRRIRAAALSSRSKGDYSTAASTNYYSRIQNDGKSTNKMSTNTANRNQNLLPTFDSSENILESESYSLELSYNSNHKTFGEKSAYPRSSRYDSGSTEFADDSQQASSNRNNHQRTEYSHIDHYHTSESRLEDTHQCGLIILGNAGVGKSFLGNILLGREAFVHEFSAGSVTHSTEFSEVQIGSLMLAIFNIPGLIEADQKRIDLNKREIDKAFLTRPNSIILYVFGNQRGRLRDEDIVAFSAINAAYSFQRESLVLVMNDLDKDRPSNYEGTTIVLLQQLLPDTEINERNICFLNRIQQNDPAEKQFLKEQLLKVAVRFIPTIHTKKHEIQTTRDQLEAEKRKIQTQQAKFHQEKLNFMQQIKKSQALLDEKIANHQTEAQSYQKAIKKQKKMFLMEQEKFEKERRQYNSQLRELRDKVNRKETYYTQLRKNDTTNEQTLRSYKEEISKLRKAYEELNQRMLAQNRNKSSCVIS